MVDFNKNETYAYPVPLEAFDPGMTLRDYFAAMALTGWMSSYDPEPANIALLCYQLADAMMEERAKR